MHPASRKSLHINGISIEIDWDYKINEGIWIVERGRGGARALVLFEEELLWIKRMCRKELQMAPSFQQLGHLRGGSRTLICSRVRAGTTRKLELRLFAPYGRFQVRIPELSLGEGWCFFSNLLSEFITSKDTYNVTPFWSVQPQPDDHQRREPGQKTYLQAASLPKWNFPNIRSSIKGQVIKVNPEDAVLSCQYMERCLVGSLEGLDFHNTDLDTFCTWINRKWRIPGGIDIKALEGQRFLFSFPSKELAVQHSRDRINYKGHLLLLDKWHSWGCCAREGRQQSSVWVKVVGLPIHLWSIGVFQSIGDFCGGFIEVDEDTKLNKTLSWARLRVEGDGRTIPAAVSIDVGQFLYDCPLWVERDPWVNWTKSSVQQGVSRLPEGRKMVAREATEGALIAGNRFKKKKLKLKKLNTKTKNW